MKHSIPKGVFDILPTELRTEDRWCLSDRWVYLEEVCRKCAADYGFKEVRTPLFEETALFTESAGESSDIVGKEMYTFLDKGGRSLSLRPEGTAPLMRAFIENHLDQFPGTRKFFYIGAMFRYERPQSGRYRQHHQFGVELIGSGKAEEDVEVIDMLCELYRRLGVKECTVMVNSVGDKASRLSFRQALINYFHPHFEKLSEESQVRFSKNVLRILDSKNEGDQKLVAGAPSILTHLGEEAKEHFEKVKTLLGVSGIPYIVNERLVRGLDYYNRTVFEITSPTLGAQNALGGGGRYDGLLKTLGGSDLPSVGWATGLERLLQVMEGAHLFFPPPPRPFVFLIPLGEKGIEACFSLLCHLRHEGIATEIEWSGKKVQKGLQFATQEQATYALVIGERELESQEIELKEMATRNVTPLRLAEVLPTLKRLHNG